MILPPWHLKGNQKFQGASFIAMKKSFLSRELEERGRKKSV
jgi:hypothetical protein